MASIGGLQDGISKQQQALWYQFKCDNRPWRVVKVDLCTNIF